MFDADMPPKSRQSMTGVLSPKLTEKELRFKNKYRWVEKRQKLRTGKGEGYSFSSIKAGLHRQDFRDTLHWSPVNHAKVSHNRHLADLVLSQLLPVIHSQHQQHGTPTGTNNSTNTASNTPPIIEEGNEDGGSTGVVQPSVASDRMSERDFQVVKSRKIDPLRSRGANRLSAKMNLDSFIDSALSEPVKEENQSNAPVDLSLGELQSAKLVESRFGWSKVRRVVNAASALSGKYATAAEPRGHETKTKTVTDEECGFENEDSTRAASEKHSPVAKKANELQRPGTADAAIAAMNAARAKLAFCVPESATHIRPRSAALHPSGDLQSIIAPVDEFVQIVRQERPKTASRLLDASGSITSQHSSQSMRPRTATLRIAPPPPIRTPDPVTETEIIQAMLATPEIAQSKQFEGLTLRLRERLISGNYSGLIYHDPNRQTTWRGVSDILAPAPFVRSKTEDDATEETEVSRVGPMTDMRWAGKTLNTYRPWSPVRLTPSAHLKLNLSKVDGAGRTSSTEGGSPGQPSSEPTSRIHSAQATTRGNTPAWQVASDATAQSASAGALPSDRKGADAAEGMEASPEGSSPRRMRRPASDYAVTKRKDEIFTSISSTGMDSLFAGGGEAQLATRHASSPSLLDRTSPPKGLVIGEGSHMSSSPSSSPRRVSTAPDATTLRPFSARPGSAVPGSSPHRPRPSTAGLTTLPAASGATRSNSVSAASLGIVRSHSVSAGSRSNSVSAFPHHSSQRPAQGLSEGHTQSRDRDSHHHLHHSRSHSHHRGVQRQSSSVFSSSHAGSRGGLGGTHHSASRSSAGSRRAPLLINIITARPALLSSPPPSPTATQYRATNSSR